MKTRLLCFLILINWFFTITAQVNNGSLNTERIFLHTDRDIYVAGDNLFYKLYLEGTPGELSRYAYLVLRDTRSIQDLNVRIEITGQTAFGNLYLPDTLSTGIYQIVCYTNCMRNNTEESFFSKEILIANRFDETMAKIPESRSPGASVLPKYKDNESAVSDSDFIISTDNKAYGPGEKVTLTVQSRNLSGNVSGNVSVSVSEVIPALNGKKDISQYLTSELLIPDKQKSDMNNCKYFSEINSPVIQGRIVLGFENNSATDSSLIKNIHADNINTLFLSSPDSLANMQITKSDSTGAFSFLLNTFYDGKQLIVRLREDVKATIAIDNKFSLNNPFIPSNEFNLQGIRDVLGRSAKIAGIKKVYNGLIIQKTVKEFTPALTIPRIYYNNYSVVYPSDYVRLNDFVEISREILPALKVRKIQDKYIADFPALNDPDMKATEPAIFLDGVPVNNIDQVIKLGSNEISRIETLPAVRYFGNVKFEGILAIFSTGMKITNIQSETPSVKINALSSQPYTKPVSYIHDTGKVTYPDLRQLLLWNPEIVVSINNETQIEFYTSDIEGKFLIDIEGITSEGKTLHGSAFILVKSHKN